MDYIKKLKWKGFVGSLLLSLLLAGLGLGFLTSGETVVIVIGCGLIIAAIVTLALRLSGHYQKQLSVKLAQTFGNDRERSNAFMQYMLESAPTKHGLHFGREFLLTRLGGHDTLLDGNDLVWVYKQITRHRLYGIIPLGKSYAVMLCTAEGKRHSIAMSEKDTVEVLNLVRACFPRAVLGYSQQVDAIFKKDPASLRGAGQKN